MRSYVLAATCLGSFLVLGACGVGEEETSGTEEAARGGRWKKDAGTTTDGSTNTDAATTTDAGTTTDASTPPSSYTCGPVSVGSGCPSVAGPNGESGYYAPSFSSNSNGYNTYVSNQDLGINGTQSLWANGPGSWKIVSNITDDGGRVQTFPDAQQLYDTTGAGNFPLSGFPALKVNYDETSPGGTANHYQFSPDVFFSNYANDVMFWVDVNGRCDEGSYGPSLLGHFTMPDGSGWTAHRYDDSSITTGNTGAEIILIKDGPGGQGTCAQEHSGVIDVKAGLAWLSSHGFLPAVPTLSILQTGWEITQSSNATFTVNSMSYVDTFN